jgi:hypothetical protein
VYVRKDGARALEHTTKRVSREPVEGVVRVTGLSFSQQRVRVSRQATKGARVGAWQQRVQELGLGGQVGWGVG